MTYEPPLYYFNEYYMGIHVPQSYTACRDEVIYPLYLQLDALTNDIIPHKEVHVEFNKIHVLQKDFTSSHHSRFFKVKRAARDIMPFIEVNATLPEPEQFIMVPLDKVVPMDHKLYFGFVVSNTWTGLPNTTHALNVPTIP